MAIVILVLVVVVLVCLLVDANCKLKEQREKNHELEKWHEIAITDNLTGIPNRMAYSTRIKEIKQKKSSGANLAIMLFDIDDFKRLNDTCGHLEGDRCLKVCAEMLKNVFSHSGCTVYRIGGDEFAVISEGASEDYIIDALMEIRRREETDLGFKISKGYSLAVGKKDFSKMFRHADEMLYADKKSKKK